MSMWGRGLRVEPLPPPPHPLPQSLELDLIRLKLWPLGLNFSSTQRVGRGVCGEGREPLLPGPPPRKKIFMHFAEQIKISLI